MDSRGAESEPTINQPSESTLNHTNTNSLFAERELKKALRDTLTQAALSALLSTTAPQTTQVTHFTLNELLFDFLDLFFSYLMEHFE